MDMTASIEARSDQINAADLVAGPRTYTIEKITKGAASHPFDFHLIESPGKAYRPNLSMRRVIVAAWGSDTTAYAGRRLTLFNEPTVIYAGAEVGGIRISHMSHLDGPMKTSLSISQKKKVPYIVQPLANVAAAAEVKPLDQRIEEMAAAFGRASITVEQLEGKIGRPRAEWTPQDVADMSALFESLRARETTKEVEFPPPADEDPAANSQWDQPVIGADS